MGFLWRPCAEMKGKPVCLLLELCQRLAMWTPFPARKLADKPNIQGTTPKCGREKKHADGPHPHPPTPKQKGQVSCPRLEPLNSPYCCEASVARPFCMLGSFVSVVDSALPQYLFTHKVSPVLEAEKAGGMNKADWYQNLLTICVVSLHA